MTYTEDEIRLIESTVHPMPRPARDPFPMGSAKSYELASLLPLTWDVTMAPVAANMFWEREALERIQINVPDHALRMHARLNRRFRLVQQGNALHLTPAPLNEADFEDGGPVVLPVNPGDLIKIRGEGSVYEAKLRDRFLQFNRVAGISPDEDLTAA